jgi:hypothetical protein
MRKIVTTTAIAMLVALSSPAAAVEPAPHYLTVCCPDQQAFDTAIALARLGDRSGLAIHIRSYCQVHGNSGRPMVCGSVVAD